MDCLTFSYTCPRLAAASAKITTQSTFLPPEFTFTLGIISIAVSHVPAGVFHDADCPRRIIPNGKLKRENMAIANSWSSASKKRTNSFHVQLLSLVRVKQEKEFRYA